MKIDSAQNVDASISSSPVLFFKDIISTASKI